jgi:hypothetical protein
MPGLSGKGVIRKRCQEPFLRSVIREGKGVRNLFCEEGKGVRNLFWLAPLC